MRSSLIALLLGLIANVAEAAITVQGTAATGGDTSSIGSYQAWTITPGGSGAAAGDLCVVDASLSGAGSSSWPTISVTGGQTWATLFQSQTSAYARARYWTTFNGTWTGGSISITTNDVPNGAYAITGVLNCFHPTSSSYTWSVDVATSQAEYSAPGGSCDVTVAGQMPTASASVVTLVTWMEHGNDTWALQTAGWVNANTTQIRNSYGGGHLSMSQAYKIQSSAAATGNVTNRQGTCNPGWTAITTFKETSGAAPATGFVNRFLGFFRGAFAYNLGGSSGTPPSNAIKFNPGFYPWYLPVDPAHPRDYLWFQLDQSGIMTDALNWIDTAVCPQSSIKGVILRVDWKSLEGDVHGDYSAGFTMVQTLGTHLAACSSGAKKLVLGMMAQLSFSYGDSRDLAYWPSWLLGPSQGGTDTAGTYGVHVMADGTYWMPSLWNAAPMQAYIDMVIAYGNHFNGSTWLEAVEIGWWQSIAGDAPLGQGYSNAGLYAQFQLLAAAARGAWPNTGIKAELDWEPSPDTWVGTLASNAIGLGGPDFFYNAETAMQWAFTGETGTDRRGVIPMWDELEVAELCDQYHAHNGSDGDPTNNYTYSQLFDYMMNGNSVTATGDTESPITQNARANRPSYVVYYVAHDGYPCGYGPQTWGAEPTGWIDLNVGGALDFIQTNPVLNTTCPTAYTAVGGCM